MKKSKILLLILPLMLSGCKNDTPIVEEPIDFTSSSVKELISKLNEVDNYTIIITDNYYFKTTGNISIYDGVYYNSLLEYGYIKSSDGVFDISRNESNEIVGGELIKQNGQIVNKIEDCDLYKDLGCFDLSYFDDGKVVDIKENANRISYLELIGLSKNEVVNVSSFTCEIDESEENQKLIFSMGFKEDKYFINSIVTNFNSTKNQQIENFLRLGGTYFNVPEEWATFRDLFNNDNYSRVVYNLEDDGTSIEVGKEYYTKNYFSTLYRPDSDYIAYSNAYFSIPNCDFTAIYAQNGVEVSRESRHFNGVYQAIVGYDSAKSEYTFRPYFGAPISDATSDVSEVLNYPKNLLMFDYFEYYSYNDVDKTYYSTDYSLAASVYLNFQLYQIIDLNEIDLVGSGFNFTLNNSDVSKSEFGIYLYFMYQGQYSYFDFHYTDFGTTSIPFLDEMCETMTYTVEIA
ncbi:MAG: hypothetical protein PUJ85_04815 [bacterium]|nr:hypothetical protein [bacterium]